MKQLVSKTWHPHSQCSGGFALDQLRWDPTRAAALSGAACSVRAPGGPQAAYLYPREMRFVCSEDAPRWHRPNPGELGWQETASKAEF